MRKPYKTPWNLGGEVQGLDMLTLMPEKELASYADQTPGTGSYLETI
jgi:hypothetical protein